MKKIIAGKLYSTETAERLSAWQYSFPSDFRYCREELFRKKNGEFFIYGEGGGMSKYRTSTGDGWTGGGEDIIKLPEPEARLWAEKHLDADEYISIFGEVEE